jgi:hypothetical protein
VIGNERQRRLDRPVTIGGAHGLRHESVLLHNERHDTCQCIPAS